MKALISISFLVAISVIASPVLAQPQDIKSFTHQVYIEGLPYEEAIKFDPRTAVPTLLIMLSDPAEEEAWPNVVIILGMLGDERAVDPLIRFLEQEQGGQLSHARYIAKTDVLMALGYLINKSPNQKALAYLNNSVKPGVWKERNLNWTSPYHANVDERNVHLSKMAILGLALSGNPSAGDTLRSLQGPATSDADRQFQTKTSDVISEAISAHETISRDGLANYDRMGRSR